MHYRELPGDEAYSQQKSRPSNKNIDLEPIRLSWRRVVDKVRTIIEEDHTAFDVFAKISLAI